jgi:hypothetical protein
MKKRDFIQTACIQFMPETQWDIDKSIQYAEKLWLRLDEKGYGEPKPTGPQVLSKAYDKLKAKPVMLAAFDLFWLAFDYKEGKQEAAGVWLQMGELSKGEYSAIVAAAKRTASKRKSLPEGQTPIMAQGWLSKERWLDNEVAPTDPAKAQQSAQQQALFKITQDLAHAKRMAGQTGEQFWADDAKKLTDQLRQLRDTTHAQ